MKILLKEDILLKFLNIGRVILKAVFSEQP